MVTNSCSGENRASGSKGSEDGVGCGESGEMKLKGKAAAVLKKGPWTAAEDAILREYVEKQGEGNWNAVQKNSGLARCGKSCRLRWANHLRPNLKKGSFSPDEERLILELHSKIGNKWARMAAQLPGRTDNEIKNYWNTRVKRRLRQGLPLYPNDIHLNTSPYHHHHDHSENTQTQTQNLLSASPPPPPHSLSLFDGAPTAANNSQPSSPRFFSPITPTLLTSNRYKRFRSSGLVDFQLPLSSIPSSLSSNLVQNLQTQFQQHHHHPSSSSLHSPSPSPFDQSMFHLPHISSFSVDSATFDQNSHQLFRTQFNPPSKNDQTAADGEDGGGFVFSLKPELPSSQFFQTTTTTTTQDDTYKEDMKMEMMNSAGRNGNNGGLLDDLLREAQAISRMNSEQDGYVAHWEDSSSVHSSSGMKRKGEQGEDHINLMHEDLSNYLNIITPSMQVPLWFTDRREISNGQSSGATDDNLGGIDENVQQLTSPLPTTTSKWDNMPRIC